MWEDDEFYLKEVDFDMNVRYTSRNVNLNG